MTFREGVPHIGNRVRHRKKSKYMNRDTPWKWLPDCPSSECDPDHAYTRSREDVSDHPRNLARKESSPSVQARSSQGSEKTSGWGAVYSHSLGENLPHDAPFHKL